MSEYYRVFNYSIDKECLDGIVNYILGFQSECSVESADLKYGLYIIKISFARQRNTSNLITLEDLTTAFILMNKSLSSSVSKCTSMYHDLEYYLNLRLGDPITLPKMVYETLIINHGSAFLNPNNSKEIEENVLKHLAKLIVESFIPYYNSLCSIENKFQKADRRKPQLYDYFKILVKGGIPSDTPSDKELELALEMFWNNIILKQEEDLEDDSTDDTDSVSAEVTNTKSTEFIESDLEYVDVVLQDLTYVPKKLKQKMLKGKKSIREKIAKGVLAVQQLLASQGLQPRDILSPKYDIIAMPHLYGVETYFTPKYNNIANLDSTTAVIFKLFDTWRLIAYKKIQIQVKHIMQS
jgi:hypothetical protein